MPFALSDIAQRAASAPEGPDAALDASLLIYAVAGVVVWLIVWWRGYLRRDSLGDAPKRLATLGARELGVGLVLLVLGSILAGVVVRVFGIAVAPEQAPNIPWRYVAQLYIGQFTAQLPAVAYLLAAAGAAPGGVRAIGLVPERRDPLIALFAACLALPMVLGMIAATVAAATIFFHAAPPPRGHVLLTIMDQTHDRAAVAAMIISAILFAPLFEELLFRGLIQTAAVNLLGGSRRWSAVLLVAGLFTLMHVTALHPLTLPGMFLLSLIFGWLYERTGRLWPGVLLHVLFNGINTLISMQTKT